MEIAVLQFFQSIRNPLFTAFFAIFSAIGEGVPLALFIAVSCFRKPETGRRSLIAAALSVCLNCALKQVFMRARPYAAGIVSLERIDTFLFSTVELDGFTSFPSGHAQITAAVFTAALTVQPRTRVFLCSVIAPFFTALSRVYFGVHYPTDVIAGLILGTAAGASAGFILRNPQALFLCAVAALSAAFFFSLREYVASASLLAGCAFFLSAPVPPPELFMRSTRSALRPIAGALFLAASVAPMLLPYDAFTIICPFLLAGAIIGAQTLFRILRI